MFSCKDSIHLLQEFLDGDMSGEERKHLEEHLAGCPPCIEFVRSYQATSTLCKKALAAQMPDELKHKLMDFLRERRRK